MAMSECGLSTNDRRLRKRTHTDRELELQDGGTEGKTIKYIIKSRRKDKMPKDDTSEVIYPWMVESRHKQKGILCSFVELCKFNVKWKEKWHLCPSNAKPEGLN